MNRRTLMLMALAAVTAPAWGDAWEAAMQPSLYSVTFADYADGEKLSDKGATGGSWTTIPALSLVRSADIGARGSQSMEFVTLSDVEFGVTASGSVGAKAFRSAVWVTAFETTFEKLPKLNAGKDKFAFSMWAPEGGKTTFVGWSADGWQKLRLASGKLAPKSGAWYDLSVWLVTGIGGKIRVQYRLKVGENEYEPLLNEADESWLNAGGGVTADSLVRSVAFRGEGAFDLMAGKELPSTGLSAHFH